jgi:hypothetical protein
LISAKRAAGALDLKQIPGQRRKSYALPDDSEEVGIYVVEQSQPVVPDANGGSKIDLETLIARCLHG